MKIHRVAILLYSIYAAVTICFTYLYLLIEIKSVPTHTFTEEASPFILILQAVGNAAAEVGRGLNNWIKYVSASLILNLLFCIFLKYAVKQSFKKTMVLPLVIVSLSFIIYILLYPILQWIFGAYYTIAFTLLLVTYFIIRLEDSFKIERQY